MLKTFCKYTVTVHRKGQQMTKIVNEDSFTIGRSFDCGLPLQDESISRVHLVVHRRQDQVWIEDSGSSNGTFVNDVRIAQNTLVNIVEGDYVRLGKSEYFLNIALEIEEREEGDEAPANESTETERLKPSMTSNLMQILKKNPQEKSPLEPLPVKTTSKPEVQRDSRPSPKKEEILKAPQKEKPKVAEEGPAFFEGEKIIHEAHKKAAKVIYEAEMTAEKRAQVIYKDARERQSQADQYYQKKMQEAHRQADDIILSFQKQGEELLEQARQFAQGIRDEVDKFSDQLRAEARTEAEGIVGEARKEAELIKQETYDRAVAKAEIKAEDLVGSATQEANAILQAANQQADEMLAKARNEMENDLKDLIESVAVQKKQLQQITEEHEALTRQIAEEHEAQTRQITAEHEALLLQIQEEREAQLQQSQEEREAQRLKAASEKEELELLLAELKAETQSVQETLDEARQLFNETRAEDADLRAKIQEQRNTTAELENQIGVLYGDSKTLERKNKELQEKLGHFELDVQSAEEQKRLVEKELAHQKALVKERIETERAQLVKASEEHVQEAQLEMSKRLQKLEQDMIEEIMGRKEKLVRDIILVVETRITKVLEPSKWDSVSPSVLAGVSEILEGKAVTFNDNHKGAKKPTTLERRKRKESLRWLSMGLTAGVLVSVLSFQVYRQVTSDQNPMRTIAAEESRRRKEDLERRKFNPAQVREVKDTYTDSVIYTSGYVAAYKDPDFQQKLYKAASAYLLKTWRVDEDKSIQVLSMSNALIKELNEKRQNIHPDFVKDGIQKMRNLEKESLQRMKAILGSEVRLESYRRFENNFFTSEVLKK